MLTATGAATEVAEVLLQTFLASPSFMQRSETRRHSDRRAGPLRAVVARGGVAALVHVVGQHARRRLDQAADAGRAGDHQSRSASRRSRMIARPQGGPDVVLAFHRAYLRAGDGTVLDDATRDPTRFPAFNDAVVAGDERGDGPLLEAVAFEQTRARSRICSRPRARSSTGTPRRSTGSTGRATARALAGDAGPKQRPGFLTRVGFLFAYAHQRQHLADFARGLHRQRRSRDRRCRPDPLSLNRW